MRNSFYLTIFFLFFFLPGLKSQERTHHNEISDMSIYQWSGRNSLISNNITSSLKSKSGYIWITSYNGIMRFDGVNIDIYDRRNLPFLITDAFYQIYETPDSTLFFVSQGSGLIKYNNEKFSQVKSKNGKIPQTITCLNFIENNSYYIGSYNKGVYKIHNDSIFRISEELPDDLSITDIESAGKNHIWIGTEGNGLYEFNDGKINHYTTKNGLINDYIRTLYFDNGQLYIGTQRGLQTFSKNNFQKPFYDSLHINHINSRPDLEHIWMATESGLGKFSKDQNKFLFTQRKGGMILTRLAKIDIEEKNNIWVSTGKDGLLHLRNTGINNYTTDEGLTTNKTNIIREHKGDLYVGTDDGNINIIKNGEISQFPFKLDLKSGIRDILFKGDEILIASYDGLLRVKSGKQKLLTRKDGLPSLDLRKILQVNNEFWIASRTSGVIICENGDFKKALDKNNGLRSNFILALEKDSRGNVYVGTHSGGLSIISPEHTIKNIKIKDNDSGILIFNIHISENDEIYLITNIGLYTLKNQTISKIEIRHSLTGVSFFDAVEDGAGSMWITTNQGILRINKNDIYEFLSGNISSVGSIIMDESDGMANQECTGATRSTLLSDNKIAIPTIGGVSIIDPSGTRIDTDFPNIYIKSLATEGKHYLNDTVELGPGNMRYTFHFSAPQFTSPEAIKFKYKLHGSKEDWTIIQNKRQIQYTSLNPGTYTFEIIPSNVLGEWSNDSASITFIVKPYYYQTTWFYILICILLMLILFLVYKWRVNDIEKRNKQLKKLNSELDRFVYSASHDLRAPLASVLGIVNLAKLDNKTDPQLYFQKIEQSIKKLDRFTKDIIDFSRNARTNLELEKINFEELISGVLEEIKYLDETRRIIIKIENSCDIGFCSDPKRLEIIFKNLISNALKYHNLRQENPQILISINCTKNIASISIKDNGSGISKEHINNIFKMFYRATERTTGSGLGLYIVAETLDKLNGRITVKSELDKGSEFIIEIPNMKKGS
ncbi:ATP-binding protein [Mangrovivirga sp. M17]|uniref:histidine kinase n=1 Tax=Mangrovivirga halotolerans TaxID=2993936 RepID=A0ABT3RKX6_9BACT|nr:sensor histidine kinase [Mangrovivirga halotolerans]MCX2742445.1 ATP-binding protein [Mangrovivirga halotolerans]